VVAAGDRWAALPDDMTYDPVPDTPRGTSLRDMTSRRLLLVVVFAALPLLGACGNDVSTAATTTGAPIASSAITKVSPTDGQALIAKMGKDLTVIDVRTPSEYAAGHLANTVNLDIEGGRFSAGIAALPKDANYMVYCHSGRRSAIAASTMAAAGFTKIYDLGGIAAWQAAGLPVVTG
jgi:rhodanese-related sulfurtransferase